MPQQASNPILRKNKGGAIWPGAGRNLQRLQAGLVVDNVAQGLGVENPNMALFHL